MASYGRMTEMMRKLPVCILYLTLLCCAVAISSRKFVIHDENITWDMNHQKGVFKHQNLRFHKLNHPSNPLHTCYRVQCFGNQCPSEGAIRDFCYPAVIITGLPKCATSAVYDALARLPNVIVMAEKENCPYTRRRSHWIYFQSLPEFSTVKEKSVIIDGCIDVLNNMKMRDFLRQPVSYYIVMIRDYADMLWSSYNFWCHLHYDHEGCMYDRWARKEYHRRSPALFHELIEGDRNGTIMAQPFYYPMHKPCLNAGGYYTEYVDFHLHRVGLQNDTIIVSSEEFEVRPVQVVTGIAKRVGIDLTGYTFPARRQGVRINAQDNKGTDHVIQIQKYKPGLYNISDYKPMLTATREMLNACWRADCLKIAERYGYYYAACLDEYLDSQKLATVPRSFLQLAWREEEKTSILAEHAMTRLLYVYKG